MYDDSVAKLKWYWTITERVLFCIKWLLRMNRVRQIPFFWKMFKKIYGIFSQISFFI